MSIENLIPTISKLQDIFATVQSTGSWGGKLEQIGEIELPQIVVVGSQSSGKSSVLESLVKRDFLPRGTGIVTRRPLILHLKNEHIAQKADTMEDVKMNGAAANCVDEPGNDYAVFQHNPTKKFYDFDNVRREIEAETDRLTGKNKGISETPIVLTIFSSKVVNLSLVDLPGIVKIPVGDQPIDIEDQVRNMIYKFIQNPKALILAVSPANQDFATSEAIKMAREVDPNGERTIAVLTKLDLMDKGTNACLVLTQKAGITVHLGIIGVVNRSQADIDKNKSITDCLSDERKFLIKHYLPIASLNGTAYLAKTLNKLLIGHIKKTLPALKQQIHSMIAACRQSLENYGEAITDVYFTFQRLVWKFADGYVGSIHSKNFDMDLKELCAGAKINKIYHETFAYDISQLDPLYELEDDDILTAIRNGTGFAPPILLPDESFAALARRQIPQFEYPSIECVDLVQKEMLAILAKRMAHHRDDSKRFPKLFIKIHEAVAGILNDRVELSKWEIKKHINCQQAYINTKNPDFVDEISEALKECGSPENVGQESHQLKMMGSLLSAYFNIVRSTVLDLVPKKITYFLIEHLKNNLRDDLFEALCKQGTPKDLLIESDSIADEREHSQAMLEVLEQARKTLDELFDYENAFDQLAVMSNGN